MSLLLSLLVLLPAVLASSPVVHVTLTDNSARKGGVVGDHGVVQSAFATDGPKFTVAPKRQELDLYLWRDSGAGLEPFWDSVSHVRVRPDPRTSTSCTARTLS